MTWLFVMQIEEKIVQFEQRKRDHIDLALQSCNQTTHLSHFDKIQLRHEALPELNFEEVSIETQCLGITLPSPIFISSMTAGHHDAIHINQVLATVASDKGYLMGVGSQRRELYDAQAAQEWTQIRKQAKDVKLLGNIGLSQVIQCSIDDVRKLCENIEAVGLFIHCNALQECIQPEGTPSFKGGLNKIEALCQALDIPIILKETGHGFSLHTLQRLKQIGLAAVDLSGIGGTHWGRIEGHRATEHSVQKQAAQTFKDWGISAVDTLIAAHQESFDFSLWGSGGVRTGLDVAKLLTLGAQMVGIAKPMLEHALQGEAALTHYLDCLEYELKVALFCTGCATISDLQEKQPWL